MQLVLIRHLPLAFGISLCAGLLNGVTAHADTVHSVDIYPVASDESMLASDLPQEPSQAVSQADIISIEPTIEPTVEDDRARLEPFQGLNLASQPNAFTEQMTAASVNTQVSQQLDIDLVRQVTSPSSATSEAQPLSAEPDVEPIPADVSTSASALMEDVQAPNAAADAASDDVTSGAIETAQAIEPGRATRTSSSYIGIGANIGFGDGDNALSEFSFATFAKIGLTPEVSLRPAVIIRDDVSVLLPITLDLNPQGVGEFAIGPYFGGGLAIATGSDSDVGPMLSAGVDVPFGGRFTGTGGINLAFLDDINVGILLGVGYNF